MLTCQALFVFLDTDPVDLPDWMARLLDRDPRSAHRSSTRP